VFSKDVVAGRTDTAHTVTTTRADLESIVTRPVMDAIAQLRKESTRNQEAVLEEKLAERMAVERKELERNWEKKIGDLEKIVADLQKEATDAKRDWDKQKERLTNRTVYLEASIVQAFEKQHQMERDWIIKGKNHTEIARGLRASLDTATARYRRAEKPREGEVRVEARLEERSRSGDGRSHSSGDRGNTWKRRDNEPSSTRKAPADVRREPTAKDASKGTAGSRKGEEKGAEPPGDNEDRGRTKQHQTAPLGVGGESQKRSGDCGQEPMQLTQIPGSPVTGRRGKPWAEDDKEAGTGVVDLSNTSFASVEAPGESTAKGDREEDVDYELSDEDGLSEEETREPAAAPPVTVAPEIEITKEEVARLRKNAKAKVQRDKAKEQALAAKNQEGGEEVDNSEVLLAVFRGQDSEETSKIQKRRRVTSDDEEEDVPNKEQEGSTGGA
jgi:hypothetical protein